MIRRATAAQMVRTSNGALERVRVAMELTQRRFEKSKRAMNHAATYLQAATEWQAGA